MKKPHPIVLLIYVLLFGSLFIPDAVRQFRWKKFKQTFPIAPLTEKARIISEHSDLIDSRLSRISFSDAIAIFGPAESNTNGVLQFKWLYPDGTPAIIELNFGEQPYPQSTKRKWKH